MDRPQKVGKAAQYSSKTLYNAEWGEFDQETWPSNGTFIKLSLNFSIT
jgi:hypothetical protein